MDKFLSGWRVFVVEDEMIGTWMLKDMLANLGCTMIGPAVQVEQALDMIEAETALDAAVLDISLNGSKSYPVADVLATRGVPFIFSTGYNRDSLPDRYRGISVLQKPYREPDLAAALRSCVSQVTSTACLWPCDSSFPDF